MGPFPSSFGNIYILLVMDLYQNGLKHHLVPEMMPSKWLGSYKEIF